MEANLIVDEAYEWNSTFVPLPSDPLFYQINVPTYIEPDCSLSVALFHRCDATRHNHSTTSDHQIDGSKCPRTARHRAVQL